MDRSESIDNTCTVCHDVIDIYAIGPCDHPVCFRCSTRMRVLCEKADCPICRSLMPQVAFVHQRLHFKDINLRDCIPNRKNKIFYEDEDIEEKFLNLLEFRCRLCPDRKQDRTFVLLQTHMRRDHQLFACDLCISYLQIFPYERKFYDRKNLALHRRVGDPDDKSYKGHPLCQFCDVRYNDKDELMKHLRKDHYFCHFCDQDGSNAYYNEYPDLKEHFEVNHFLCTEDLCGDPSTQFTHAFSSEIDLKAHKAKMHTKHMSKLQSREARNIEVDFQYQSARRSGYGGRGASHDYDNSRGNRGGDRYKGHQRRDRDDPQMLRALAESMETAAGGKTSPPMQERVPDPVHDFPTLNGAPASVQIQSSQFKPHATSREEDFPSLRVANSQGDTSQAQSSSKGYASIMNFQMANSKPVVAKVKEKKSESKPAIKGNVSSASNDRWATRAPTVSDENFPSLGGRKANSSNNISNVVLSSNWSKPSFQNNNYIDNQVTIVPNRTSLMDEQSKKVKLKTSRQLDKNIEDEKEFPTLDGSGRKNSMFNNPLLVKPKSAKRINSPRTQKVDDDSFELPQSYYKAYEPNESSLNVRSEDRTDVSKVHNEVVAPVLNKSKDFPSLPAKKQNASSNSDSKTKTTKPKEKRPEQKSSTKSKKSGDGLSSLSDIAQGLVVNGDDSRKIFKDKTNKGHSLASKQSTRKPDWFDNPPVENHTKVVAKPVKKSTSVEDVSKESVNTIDNSFPSLHTMSTPIQDTQAPPGFSPNPIQMVSPSVNSAPPGFSKSLTAPPGFSTVKTPAVYIQPADFSARNQQLIKDIHNSLFTIETGFQSFKTFSGQYRGGLMEGVDYYLKCQKLMGEEDFSKVFPELIALLPDLPKQQELWAVHQTAISNTSNVSKSGKHSHSQNLWKNASAMYPCPRCTQIVLLKDEQHHILQHGEQKDFPSLGGVATNKSNREGDMNRVAGWVRAK